MSVTAEHKAFLRHLGVWRGTHRVLLAEGVLVDRYQAEVSCRIENGRYYQHTRRTWADGRMSESGFEARFAPGGRLLYESAAVVGGAAAIDDGHILSQWSNPADPTTRWVAIITLLDPTHRVRTAQHIENGRMLRVMLMDETKVE